MVFLEVYVLAKLLGKLAWIFSLALAVSIILYTCYIIAPAKRAVVVDKPIIFGEKFSYHYRKR